MTTSDREHHHIKPIIASHDHHHESDSYHTTYNEASGSSSLENSPLRRGGKSTSSFKRVSFGGSKGNFIQTYIYESVPTVEEGKVKTFQALAHNSDSPPSKVKVTSLESETPHSIHPPAALDTSGSSDSGALAAERRVQIISPPLPSSKRMEVENPFRPDGTLSHEVEPIVETYKHRPFPSGHRDSADGSLSPLSSTNASPAKVANLTNSLQPTTNGTTHQNNASSKPVVETQQRSAQLEIQHKHVAPTKANHLELVHIEPKKRKCGCCTIQ